MCVKVQVLTAVLRRLKGETKRIPHSEALLCDWQSGSIHERGEEM